ALYRYEKTYPIRNFQAAEDMDGEIAARPNNVLYDNELTIGEKNFAVILIDALIWFPINK
ncbi:hypothetical protein JGX46_14980, partial [Listeria monocytogenes]|nr:hypothetical protein [Listeria monocytogenes]